MRERDDGGHITSRERRYPNTTISGDLKGVGDVIVARVDNVIVEGVVAS